MVNSNIQGAVPLIGNGFVARRLGDFQPGEYKRLSNVEILDNSLENRRSVHSIYGDASGAVTAAFSSPFGFIGSMNDYSIIVSDTQHDAVNGNSRVALWGTANLNVPAPAGSFHRFLGFFRYNYKNWWLTVEFNAGVEIKFNLYHGAISTSADVPASYGAAYFATLTKTTILTIPLADVSFPKVAFRNFFMMNDRLWLVLSTGVYFSKATDPLTFTVPDGGFFKFPDSLINWAVGVNKTVSVFMDNQVNQITFNTDPNTDSYVRLLSDNVGGDHATVFRDTPVFINQRGIFTVINNSVDKIMDNEFDVGDDYYANCITAFEDYLIVNKFIKTNYEKFDSSSTSMRTNLVPNPSLETNFNHYGASTDYVLRTRDVTDKYVGAAASHKSEKTNDKTVINDSNFIMKPKFTGALGGFWGTSFTSDVGIDTIVNYAASLDWGNSAKGKIGWTGVTNQLDVRDASILLNTHFIAVDPSTNYTASASLCASDALGSVPAPFTDIVVAWYDAGFNLINNGASTPHVSTVQPTRKYFNVTSPVNAAHAVVTFRGQIPGSFGFTYNSADINYWVVQPMFEEGWTDGTGYFDGDTADSAEFTYTWDGAADGSISRQMGYGGPVGVDVPVVDHMTDFINVASSTGYTFGFAHKKVTAPVLDDVNIKVEINQYDAGNNLLSTATYPVVHDYTSEQGWAFKTISFTTSSTCTKFKWRILMPFAEQNYGQIDRWDAFHCETTSTWASYFDGDAVDTPAVTYAWTGAANDSTSTATITAIFRAQYKNGRRFISGLRGNSLGHNVYFLNMSNKAVHVFDFTDSRDTAEKGYPVEFFVNNNKDDSGNYNCFFLVNKFISEGASSVVLEGNVYYINSYKESSFYDYAVDSAHILKKYFPKVWVEIDAYTPDGSEYNMKKFRNLEIMAKVPKTDFKVAFGYYNQSFLHAVDISSTYTDGRPHYPHRIGLNQRGRSLGIKLYNENSDVAQGSEVDYGSIEISDIRTLWTYTGRGPTVKSAGAIN